ncbi:MAG: class I SAM-dependent methyltransferase, partial [Solirubrobacterales bacterium]
MDEAVYRVMAHVEDRHWWFRGRRAVIGALLTRAAVPPGTAVLDAGCGTGRNLELYRRIGPASGVDPSPDAVSFCRARGLSDVRLG